MEKNLVASGFVIGPVSLGWHPANIPMSGERDNELIPMKCVTRDVCLLSSHWSARDILSSHWPSAQLAGS